ncbi:hypothetical protein AB5J72_17860 [Streptomyces sp. CG1]|uniref:hypothetical protein n=1 Tax=Streptomyces sp. CG1 TaxID=1287523 RepID=UPI0034E2B46C
MSSLDHASADRRAFLTAAGAAGLAAGVWWAGTARGVVLRTLAGSGTVDIDCAIRLRAEADPGDHSGRSWRLRVLEHRMQGRQRPVRPDHHHRGGRPPLAAAQHPAPGRCRGAAL